MGKIRCPKCGGEISIQDLVAWRPNECPYCGYVDRPKSLSELMSAAKKPAKKGKMKRWHAKETRFETALGRIRDHFDAVQETFHLTNEEMRDIADIIRGDYQKCK